MNDSKKGFKILSTHYQQSLFIATLCILSTSFSSDLNAQNIRLSGTIIDLETRQPVPLVSVFTTDRRFGTISNDRGAFSLYVPQNKLNTHLHLSHMSFESDSILISRTDMPERIFLLPTSFVLSEVVIMPDCSLLALLRRAYERIPENFSNHPVLYTGFFQHSQANPKGELISLVEAELSVFKEAKHRPRASTGQVEILQSRIVELQSRGGRGGFIGSAFAALEDDVVLQRSSFIVPRNFRHFNYTFLGVTSWRGRPVYKIQFEPRRMDFGSFQGTMLIDRETLAYVSFDITRENPCAANQVLGIGIPPVWSHRQIVYEQHNGKWHLMHTISRVRHENFRFSEPFYSSIDFITTYIQTENVQPIPPDRRLGRTDPIETTAERFSPEEGWTDFDVVDDKELAQTGFQFSTIEAYHIFHQEEIRQRNTFSERMLRILPRIVYGVGIQYNPHYSHIPFHLVYGYRLNRQWSIQARAVGSFYDTRISLEQSGLGVEWRRNLGQSGNPPFFGTSLWISNNRFEQMGRESLRYQTIIPQISLSRQVGRGRGGFSVFANYPIVIHSNIEMNRRRSPNVGITWYLLFGN